MRFLLFIILCVGLSSCCSKPLQTKTDDFALTEEQQKLRVPFSKINERVYYKMGKGEISTFESFTFSKYQSYLESLKTEQPETLKKLLKEYDYKEVFTSKDNFIICLYSKEMKIGVCDDPSCPEIPLSQFFQGELGDIKSRIPKEICK